MKPGDNPNLSMPNPIISCGMYAFSATLRNAWQALFGYLYRSLSLPASTAFDIRFDNAANDLHNPNLYLGHTCGYPFWKGFFKTHEVITVPEFSIAGCSGADYSSWIVVRASDSRKSLGDFRDSIAVVNCHDSNSGMNVFRHEVSRVAAGACFFREVKISGSHLNSLSMIQNGIADIAAIDAITFGLAKRSGQIDSSMFKILLQTRSTPGLPFIAHRQSSLDAKHIASTLNEGLAHLSQEGFAQLPIRQFSSVEGEQYHQIMELEEAAIHLGYPELA